MRANLSGKADALNAEITRRDVPAVSGVGSVSLIMRPPNAAANDGRKVGKGDRRWDHPFDSRLTSAQRSSAEGNGTLRFDRSLFDFRLNSLEFHRKVSAMTDWVSSSRPSLNLEHNALTLCQNLLEP